MPRITHRQYCQRHALLRKVWLQSKQTFGLLSPTEQWLLHDYFRPADELARRELLKHRRHISRAQPSLPHQAGKVYTKLRRIIRGKEDAFVVRTSYRDRRGRQRVVTIYPVVRPRPSVHQLVEAFLALAKEQEELRRS